MIEPSLGQRLRELRDKADCPRGSWQSESAFPFGYRAWKTISFRSEEVLGKLVAALKLPLEDLKQYDESRANSTTKKTGKFSF
jgi:hypothetical protein